MKNLFTNQMREQLSASRAIATVTIDKVEDTQPLAEALLSGGVRVVEVTLRTPLALQAMRSIAKNYPELLVMAGTVITPQQVKQVQDAGAVCAVAPGMNRRVIEAAFSAGLPFAPGVTTPSEIEAALEYNCDLLKYFPAESMGGIRYLKNMQAPYAHLGLKFIPLGGLNSKNAGDYLKEDCILAVGGSWIANADAIRSGDWNGIEQRAAALMKI
ncbi:MAG: keto-deoxy-phosphogluconate aldolase [Coraliomargarita sp.]|nr:keto-deoxy-phosphogluconate aldolase [Coraliomargarita sp.]|tara:strand:- start:2964 stop:3605 length:642 start_codon:yes stop_codon:yes gene_type:complete